MMFRKVLLPTDFGAGYEAELEVLEKEIVHAEEVIILHVVDKAELDAFKESHRMSEKESRDAIEEAISRKMWIEASRISEIFGTENVRTALRFGVPSEEIVKAAKEENVSVIIMTAFNPGTKKQIDSTALKVLSSSERPVLFLNTIGR